RRTWRAVVRCCKQRRQSVDEAACHPRRFCFMLKTCLRNPFEVIMRYLLTFLTLLLISASTAAQEATPEISPQGWEVVQRCITAPSEPPEGWTFEGTIFTYRGSVHGFRADLPSPYYIAFGSDTEFGGAGTFSPDGLWYALPRVRTRMTSMTFTIYHVVETIRVVSTTPDRVIVDIPTRQYDRSSFIQGLQRPRWID